MARPDPVGFIVLQPDEPDGKKGKIRFTSPQDFDQDEPAKAKILATRGQEVRWLIENYFKYDIVVTLVFDPKKLPFPDAKKLSTRVKAFKNKRGKGKITPKVKGDAKNDGYKYTINAKGDALGIPDVDPMLEIDDGAVIIPP